jgi:hypothetical protein
VLSHDISHFLELRSLQRVELLHFLIDTTKTSLLAMLGAWPYLRILIVNVPDNNKVIPLIQFIKIMSQVPTTRVECIFGFDISCPLIGSLPATTDVHYPHIRHMKFTVADSDTYPGDLLIEEHASLAFYLMKMFPSYNFTRYSILPGCQLSQLLRAAGRARKAGVDWTLADYKKCAIELIRCPNPHSSFGSLLLDRDYLFGQ